MSNWDVDNANDANRAPTGATAEEFTVDGKPVMVEVEETNVSEPTFQRFAASGGPPRTMEEAIDSTLPAANLLLQRIVALPNRPKAVEVEFGVKLSGKVGALIASTALEGNFKVKLTWKD
ncbi:MAG: CU044_2847 family protein [Pseudomonadota bacterium]